MVLKNYASNDMHAYKTMYRWLRGGHMRTKKNRFTTKSIAMNTFRYWCRRDESNTRPSPDRYVLKSSRQHPTGALYPLLALPLSQVNEDTLKSWFDREALAGKHQAARALMMFRGFMCWCSAKPEYRALVDRDAGKAAALVEGLPSNTRRADALEAAQVPGWYAGVEQLNNRNASVYLRALLVTGARREEMAALKWAARNVTRYNTP